MVLSTVCGSCLGVDLSFFGLEGRSEPDHCYGRSDRPAAPGVLGGYRCSCECRRTNDWPEKARSDASNTRDSGSSDA